jgi:hypothetical protein
MERLDKGSLILKLIDIQFKKGYWSGETHIQKCAYLLQDLTMVPMEFNFILYKHGPFSFDLRNELTSMRADGFIKFHVSNSYRPRLVITELGKMIIKRYDGLISEYLSEIKFISKEFGKKGVADLERLTTALYFIKNFKERTHEENASYIHKLKPHIKEEIAIQAIKSINNIRLAVAR